MTTVISVVTSHVTIHASDRLLTIPGPAAWDTMSNKTVIHYGINHAFVLGYSGTAFTGSGTPTDQWATEVLTGADLSPGGFALMGAGSRLDAYSAIEAIREQAPNAFRGSREPPVFMVAGWQRQRANRRGTRPFMVRIVGKSAQKLTYVSEWLELPNYFGKLPRFELSHVGVLPRDVLTRLRQRIAGARSVEHIRKALIRAIRETSQGSKLVGSDVMTVVAQTWPFPNGAFAKCRFEPDTVGRLAKTAFGYSASVGLDRSGRPIHVEAFTPFVISPRMVLLPATITQRSGQAAGGWEHTGSNFKVTFDSPLMGRSASPNLISWNSQRRRRHGP